MGVQFLLGTIFSNLSFDHIQVQFNAPLQRMAMEDEVFLRVVNHDIQSFSFFAHGIDQALDILHLLGELNRLERYLEGLSGTPYFRLHPCEENLPTG